MEKEQCLYELGFTKEEIDKLYDDSLCLEAKKRILCIHRCKALDEVHQSQKKLECIDYFIYEITKENKK